MDKSHVKTSKALSYLLRHNLRDFNVREGGYVGVNELLAHQSLRHSTVDDITEVVKCNTKKRFGIKTDAESQELLICAYQGHSVDVPNLELAPITSHYEVPTVIHGTRKAVLSSIMRDGLKRMGRMHIHFAAGELHEVTSGYRNSSEVLIYINMKSALEDGIPFYHSPNNVVLTPGDETGTILPKYFLKVIER